MSGCDKWVLMGVTYVGTGVGRCNIWVQMGGLGVGVYDRKGGLGVLS